MSFSTRMPLHQPLAPVSQLVIHPEFKDPLFVQDPLLSTLDQPLVPLLPKNTSGPAVCICLRGHCQQQYKLKTTVSTLPPGCQHPQCCPVAPTKTSAQCPPSISVCWGGWHIKPIRRPGTEHVTLHTSYSCKASTCWVS